MNEAAEGTQGVEVPEGGAAPGGGGAKPMMVAMIAVLVLAFQIVSSHYIVKMLFFSKPPEAVAEEQMVDEKKTEEVGQIYKLETLLINPEASRGSKHLLVDIGIEASDPAIIGQLEVLDPVLRDNISTLLSSQPLDVLTNILMRDKLRLKIEEIANFHLKEGEVDRVYFIRYVFP
ncbi:flagellar basal body-associated FliL family protein [bacterium]|nr:flagellar basal body-associated FliL family protein [bacterium]